MPASTPSTEELLKLIELAKSTPEASEPNLNEAERFVISLGIKEGSEKIHPMLVWYTYIKWIKKPLITRDKFFRQFKKLFKQRRSPPRHTRYYYLDPSSFDTSQDTYFLIQKMLRDEREYRKKYGKKVGEE